MQRALGRRDGRAFKVVFMLSLVHLALTPREQELLKSMGTAPRPVVEGASAASSSASTEATQSAASADEAGNAAAPSSAAIAFRRYLCDFF